MPSIDKKQDCATARSAAERQPSGIRLEFLDGLRGLAALYVVLHHIHQEVTYNQGDRAFLPLKLLAVTKWLALGHYGVAVFIVISGYSLMLPIVRSGAGRLRGGFRNYIFRRARRILPPYYAALVLSLIIFALTPALQHPSGWRADLEFPAVTFNAIWSHVLLVHNFTPWVFKINAPMWSVATEWQIYFLFPFLLLPIWRRYGIAPAVAAGFVVGFIPHFIFRGRLDAAVPWYLGLFAMGMAAAVVSFSDKSQIASFRSRMPWLPLTLILGVALAVTIKIWPDRLLISDPLAGAAATCLIMYCGTMYSNSRSSVLMRIFQSRWAVLLGVFSYSLYLVHSPLISLVHIALRSQHFSPLSRFILLPVVGVPVILAVSYLFHLAFEKRFLGSSMQPETQNAAAGRAL